jgi:hypothetical protein
LFTQAISRPRQRRKDKSRNEIAAKDREETQKKDRKSKQARVIAGSAFCGYSLFLPYLCAFASAAT